MIKDLVAYFLRQGDYNEPGDIAVLCAYLGQVQKVRQALKEQDISTTLDERDAEQLLRQDMGMDFDEDRAELMKLDRRVSMTFCLVGAMMFSWSHMFVGRPRHG